MSCSLRKLASRLMSSNVSASLLSGCTAKGAVAGTSWMRLFSRWISRRCSDGVCSSGFSSLSSAVAMSI